MAPYLFGSRSRGQQRSTSDVDIGVLFAPATESWETRLDLAADLEDRLGQPVDLLRRLALIRHSLARLESKQGSSRESCQDLKEFCRAVVAFYSL